MQTPFFAVSGSLPPPIEEFTSPTGVKHSFNINPKLNELLLKSLLKTTDQPKTGYTLDYNNQVIATEKYDSKKIHKKCNGYQLGVATIGRDIVYIEGRNGNSRTSRNPEKDVFVIGK